LGLGELWQQVLGSRSGVAFLRIHSGLRARRSRIFFFFPLAGKTPEEELEHLYCEEARFDCSSNSPFGARQEARRAIPARSDLRSLSQQPSDNSGQRRRDPFFRRRAPPGRGRSFAPERQKSCATPLLRRRPSVTFCGRTACPKPPPTKGFGPAKRRRPRERATTSDVIEGPSRESIALRSRSFCQRAVRRGGKVNPTTRQGEQKETARRQRFPPPARRRVEGGRLTAAPATGAGSSSPKRRGRKKVTRISCAPAHEYLLRRRAAR